jgi:glycosyltransferase involved in cell wall biosynthesis
MLSLGIPADKISILEGFYGVRAEDLGPVPLSLEPFLRDHSPVVGAMASVGPEYGIPLLIHAACSLHSRYPRLGLVLIGPEMPEKDGSQGGLLITGSLPHPAVLGIMQRLDVFVRPTYFDGDASSVREALALGVPVVASDTDFRPKGVILFRRGDSSELTRKLVLALEGGRTVCPRLSPNSSESLERLLVIYERLGAHA